MSKQNKMFCYLPTTAISGSCLWRHLGCSRTRFWWWCCHWLRGIRYWSADWSKMLLLLLFQGAYKKENTHVTHAHVRGKSSMLWKQMRGEAITATIWFDNSWITQDYYVIKLQTPAVIIQIACTGMYFIVFNIYLCPLMFYPSYLTSKYECSKLQE